MDKTCENCKTEIGTPCFCQKGICSTKSLPAEMMCEDCGHVAWPSITGERAESR